MAAEAFGKLWEFEDGQEVCIKHSKKDFLRVDGDNLKDIDFNGKLGGGKAIWKAKKHDDDTVSFQNTKTEKFLRIEPDGKGWDSNGKEDGGRTLFKIVSFGKGSFQLHAEKKNKNDEFQFLGCKNDDPVPLQIFAKGDKKPFSVPFNKTSQKKEKIVIQHKKFKNIRKKKDDVDSDGGYGEPAQWKLIMQEGQKCRLKNIKGGDFLRIKKDGDEIDAGGSKDGKFTEFKMIQIFGEGDMEHHVHFKSVETGKFVGVGGKGKVRGFDEKSEKTRFALFTED